jgi:hypothetical protein
MPCIEAASQLIALQALGVSNDASTSTFGYLGSPCTKDFLVD